MTMTTWIADFVPVPMRVYANTLLLPHVKILKANNKNNS
jgi:hypothetical protein